jgi:hypothetical protein
MIALGVAAGAAPARATDFYVAPSGDDANPGSEAKPFATMARGQMAAVPGDTVYLRGGTYAFTSATAADGIDLTKSGTAADRRISYVAYPGETPVFDFAGMTAMARIKGINVTASFILLQGIELKNVPQNITTAHESWGIYNDGGSNNVYDRLNLHHNMGPGLFIVHGSNNLVENCDSHHNYDPKSSTGPGTNADGFGCHVNKAGDTGNVFRGCRAWWNSDDGFDLIQAQEAVVIEDSWAFYNGYLPDSTSQASGGDGNGFKAGGYGIPATNVPASPPSHTVRRCVAFRNRAAGFYQNHHPVADHFYNDTSYSNASSDFNLLGLNGNVGILRNDIAFGGTLLANGSGVDDASNSWTLPVTVSAADFEGVDVTGVDGPRNADGSVPNLPFLRLAKGSDLIDVGVDVGLPYVGKAPDLGAFEFGAAVGAGGAGTGGAAGVGASAGSSGAGGNSGAGGTGGTISGAAGAQSGGQSTSSSAGAPGGGSQAGGASGSGTQATSGGSATTQIAGGAPGSSGQTSGSDDAPMGTAAAGGSDGAGCQCGAVGATSGVVVHDASGGRVANVLCAIALVSWTVRRRRAKASSSAAR